MIFNEVMDKSRDLAKERGHHYVLIDHLLHVLVNQYEEAEVILSETIKKFDIDTLKSRLEERLNSFAKAENVDVVFDGSDITRIIELVVTNCQSRFSATIADIIYATVSIIYEDKRDDAHYENVLLEFVTADELEKQIFAFVSGGKVENDDSDEEAEEIEHQASRQESQLLKPIEHNHGFKMVGREKELDKLIHTMGLDTGAFAVVVADNLDGKTSIIQEFVNRINSDECLSHLKGLNVVKANPIRLAGIEHHRQNVQAAILIAKRENKILVIEDCHTFSRSMSEHDMAATIANATKDGLKVICTTHSSAYSRIFEKKNVSNSVTKIQLGDLSKEHSVEVLNAEITRLEEKYQIQFEDGFTNTTFEAVKNQLKGSSLSNALLVVYRSASICTNSNRDVVTVDDIKLALSEIRNLPVEDLSLTDNVKVMTIGDKIRENLFGQDEAIDKVVESIQVSKMGFKEDENRPNGVFIFLGSTGVGKTELAYQAAHAMGVEVIRLDMAEYQESHTVSKLLGSPPGYVGYQDGDGALYEKLSKNPDAVVVFDEIEKAHPSITKLLLGALDYGILTTSSNKEVNFRNAFVIFTSNIGVVTKSGGNFGFGTNSDDDSDVVEFSRETYESTFAPEFRNRIDYEIEFKTLTQEAAVKVAEKSAKKVAASILKSRGIKLTVNEKACELLTKRHYSLKNGARQISRGFRSDISMNLMKAIANHVKEHGTDPKAIKVSTKKDEFVIKTS